MSVCMRVLGTSGYPNKFLDPLGLQLHAGVSHLDVGTGNKLHSCLRAVVTLSCVLLLLF